MVLLPAVAVMPYIHPRGSHTPIDLVSLNLPASTRVMRMHPRQADYQQACVTLAAVHCGRCLFDAAAMLGQEQR
jgi:hypothetical protein